MINNLFQYLCIYYDSFQLFIFIHPLSVIALSWSWRVGVPSGFCSNFAQIDLIGPGLPIPVLEGREEPEPNPADTHRAGLHPGRDVSPSQGN